MYNQSRQLRKENVTAAGNVSGTVCCFQDVRGQTFAALITVCIAPYRPHVPSGLQCLIVYTMAAWFGFPRTLFPLSVNHLKSLSCPLRLSFITAAQNMNRTDFDYCQALQHDPCEKTAFFLSTGWDAGTDRLVAPSHSCLSFRHSLASVSSSVSTRRFTWLLISLSHVATD